MLRAGWTAVLSVDLLVAQREYMDRAESFWMESPGRIPWLYNLDNKKYRCR